jgi:hypothetical protein
MREKKYNDIIEKINNELENENCEIIKEACFKCDIDYRQYFSARDYYLKPKNKNNMKQMPKTKKIKKMFY